MEIQKTQLRAVDVLTTDGRRARITARSAEAVLLALFDVQAYVLKVREDEQAQTPERTHD